MATEGLPQSPSHVWIYSVLEDPLSLTQGPLIHQNTYVTLFILDNSYIYEGLNKFYYIRQVLCEHQKQSATHYNKKLITLYW